MTEINSAELAATARIVSDAVRTMRATAEQAKLAHDRIDELRDLLVSLDGKVAAIDTRQGRIAKFLNQHRHEFGNKDSEPSKEM